MSRSFESQHGTVAVSHLLHCLGCADKVTIVLHVPAPHDAATASAYATDAHTGDKDTAAMRAR